MATLNLNEKKIPSAENLRLIAQLCISLANKQSSLEDRCIAPWKSGEVYQKDISYVSYNDYLYFCTVSNSDTDFVESHWTKLSDTISELTKSDIEALVNLSPAEISKLSDLISTEIRLDKTFSSSDTYTRIQAAIDTAKEYTNNQLGKAVKPAYKVVSSTSEVTETGYFYLISNGANYDMYVLSSNGSVVSLGTSEVDLSNYYDKTEIEADFLKKTDATSTYATITTVDGKVDKTSIITTKDNSATDDQVYSAKVINTELDRVVKKTNISTTIDSTSTNDTVPTNKAVYDSLINKVNNTIVLTTADEVNSFDRVYQSFIIGPSVAEAVGLPKAPDSTWFCINLSHVKGFKYPSQIAFEYAGIERIMYRTAHNGVWHNWRKMPTTSVADAPTVTKEISSDEVSSGAIKYTIINGICHLCLLNFVFVNTGIVAKMLPDNTVPRCAIDECWFPITIINGGAASALIKVSKDGSLSHYLLADISGPYTGYISYPVAES